MHKKNLFPLNNFLAKYKNASFRRRYRLRADAFIRMGFFLISLLSVVFVCAIVAFIFSQGLSFFLKISVKDFIFSFNWKPSGTPAFYGIGSFILTSFYVTILSLVFSVPIAIACAVYLTVFSTGYIGKILQTIVEILSGIPSIIFGLFGIAFLVPLVRSLLGGNGFSLLTAALMLSIMILPIIINISQNALREVPVTLLEASYALGATPWQTISRILLPSAKSGIVTACVLAGGRAIGETTAVLLVAGNAPLFPDSILSMGRTLTMNIITDMSYAEGVHMESLFATAIVLFIFIILIDFVTIAFIKKMGKKVGTYDI